MSNKLYTNSLARIKRRSAISPFQFDLVRQNQPSASSLIYSKTSSTAKFINLDKIPSKEIILPNTVVFSPQIDSQRHTKCNRKDCLDRKFQGIKLINRSTQSVKMVSPRRVDIILQQNNDLLSNKRKICIHSARQFNFNKKVSKEKDLLKQFKALEQMRKELRSRSYQPSKKLNLSVNSVRKISTADPTTSRLDNPQKANLYHEVKTRISRRYNQMFKKFAEGVNQQIKADNLFLKELCKARSINKLLQK